MRKSSESEERRIGHEFHEWVRSSGRLWWKMWEKAIDYGVKVSYCLSPLSGGVAQLVRALPCHGRGYGFEPRRSRHLFLGIFQMFL